MFSPKSNLAECCPLAAALSVLTIFIFLVGENLAALLLEVFIIITNTFLPDLYNKLKRRFNVVAYNRVPVAI